MKKKINLTLVIIVFWLLIVVGGYYLIHNPIPVGMIQPLLQSFWSIFAVVALTALAGGIGFKILRIKGFFGLTQSVLQAALGFGLIALAIMLLGTIWKINEYIVFFLIPFFLVVFFRDVRGWFKSWWHVLPDHWDLGSPFQRVLILLISVIFLLTLLTALAPPIKYDALNYHLTLPKTYLLNQKIADIPWLVMSGMPQTTEMLYLVAVALGGESAPLVLNWMFGLLTVLGLAGYLSVRINSQAAWVGASALLGGFTLASALSWGYVGWLSALFGLCTLVMLDQFYDSGGNKQLVFFAGLFAGLAFSTKYPAGVILASGGVVVCWVVFRRKQTAVPVLWRFALGGFLFSAPWLIKNLMLTKNPLYPFFWESGAMDAVRIAVYQGAPTFGDWTDLVLLPIKAVLTGVDATLGYSVSMGPLMLALGVLAFLGWSIKSADEKQSLSVAGLITLTGIIIWAVGNQLSGYLIQTRFYFVLFPAFAALAGFGYQEIKKLTTTNDWLEKLANTVIIFVLLFNVVQISRDVNYKGAVSVLFGDKSRQDYLYDNLGWYAVALDEIQKLPDTSKVIMFYEPRGYGCVPKCDPDEILDRWKTENIRYDNYQTMELNWLNQGFSHLLVYSGGVAFLRGDNDPHHPVSDLDALETYLKTLPAPIDIGGWYALYEIPNKDL